MPIAFGRCQFIQRSHGNSATRVAAYNARTVIVDDRTGELHDFRRMKGDLVHHEIMLPVGADPDLGRAAIISNMSEAAERRKDARVGREFIWALPELTVEERIELLRSFVKEHFTDKSLPFQLDIHGDHAHGWTPMRRLEGDRFAQKQAVELLPTLRTSPYGTFVAEADRWGQLWAIHQERWFYAHKLDLHVDPIAIHPEKRSYGPRRSWGPDPEHSRAAALIEERRLRNQEAARNPQLVYEFSLQQKFNGTALNRFLEKWLPNTDERQHITEQVYELRDKDLAADKVDSWWRPLAIEDLAFKSAATVPFGRDQKPHTYAELVKLEEPLRAELRHLTKSIAGRKNAALASQARAENRWMDMNILQKALHVAHIYRDIDVEDYKSRWRRSQNSRVTANLTGDKRITDWGAVIHHRHVEAQLDVIKQAREKIMEAIRPQAEAELKRRRQIAQTARQTLVSMQQEDILKQRRSHALRSGP